MAEAQSFAATGGGFRAAYAAGGAWGDTTQACLEALGELPTGANLGFVYATDALSGDLQRVVERLRQRTGIANWVGTVGTGVSACGVEIHDRPGLAVLVGTFAEDGFRIFEPVADGLEDFTAAHGAWIEKRAPFFGIVHADPRAANLPDLLAGLSAQTASFLVGGLTASRGEMTQIAGRVSRGGLSGALFSPDLQVVAGLTQGCSPIAPPRVITEADENIVMTIDERPAVEVLNEDVGELLARDTSRIAGYIFAAFPIAESDTGDYLVRNLTGIDPERGWLAVGHLVGPGDRIMFCRRDHDAAVADMKRMLDDVKRRAERPPRAGVYYSCVARGPRLFGRDSEELKMIRDALGDLPLVGFFANGEISHDRLYGYTGVLALFL
jgi:small ligand-binding sensory domain FIST